MNEIKKTVKDRKEKIHKISSLFCLFVDKSTNLINNQSEMNKSISQTQKKSSIKSLVNRVGQVENKVPGTKDKIEYIK
jgi:DNA anti-recombination protein RmuC